MNEPHSIGEACISQKSLGVDLYAAPVTAFYFTRKRKYPRGIDECI